MASINSISADKLGRLIGTLKCPALVDVRRDEDFTAAPGLIPGSVRLPYADVPAWAQEFAGRNVIAICQKGQKFSPGVAAWLRHAGAAADTLEGGVEAWIKT